MTNIAPTAALDAADAVLAELLARGGFDEWWRGSIPENDIREEIRWAIARAITEAMPAPIVPELLTTEHTCGLPDTDEQRRAHALHCAASRLVYGSPTPSIAIPATLEVARAFEAYLRGDQ